MKPHALASLPSLAALVATLSTAALLTNAACGSSASAPGVDAGGSAADAALTETGPGADSGADGATPADAGGDGASPTDAAADSGLVSADLGTFGLDCSPGSARELPFPVRQGEVFRFDTTWSAATEAVPSMTILDPAGREISVRGNPLGIEVGLVGTTPKSLSLVHEFSTPSGSYKIRIENAPPGCSPLTVSAKYAAVAAPMTNLSQASAQAVTKGVLVNGHIGCDTQRWFKVVATANEPLALSLSGTAVAGQPADFTATLVMDLLDATGQPVIESGNPVDAIGELPAPAPVVLRHTAAAGTYFLRLTPQGCGAVLNYSLGY